MMNILSIRLVRIGVALVLCGSAGGCATLRGGDGLKTAHLERLYFGRNIKDSAVVTDSAWNVFVHETLTPAFPEGATVWEANGQWRDPSGALIREKSFVVELLHLVTRDVEDKVQKVMDDYKTRFCQQSVLRVVTLVRASF
jgi:hypothetical protein